MGVGAAIAVAALGTASAIGKYNQEKSAARWKAKEGQQALENRKKEILQLAAQQKMAYLDAGLDLEGTPQSMIQETYQIGIEDVKALSDSYNQQITNQIRIARAELVGNIANAGFSAASTYMAFGGGGQAPLKDVTNTAGSGGNVTFTNASYTKPA
jgi:hypothetical protein